MNLRNCWQSGICTSGLGFDFHGFSLLPVLFGCTTWIHQEHPVTEKWQPWLHRYWFDFNGYSSNGSYGYTSNGSIEDLVGNSSGNLTLSRRFCEHGVRCRANLLLSRPSTEFQRWIFTLQQRYMSIKHRSDPALLITAYLQRQGNQSPRPIEAIDTKFCWCRNTGSLCL
jgi:hypothetical protein